MILKVRRGRRGRFRKLKGGRVCVMLVKGSSGRQEVGLGVDFGEGIVLVCWLAESVFEQCKVRDGYASNVLGLASSGCYINLFHALDVTVLS